jgi:hypothetical protein
MKHLQHSRPLLFGVLAGALAPAVLEAALLALSPERVMIPVLSVALIAFLISLAASAIIGLPLALWLRSKEWLTVISLCIAGLIVGAIVMAAFNFHANYWPQMNDQSLAKWIAWNSAMKGALSGAIFGAISSIAFCLGAGVAVRSR